MICPLPEAIAIQRPEVNETRDIAQMIRKGQVLKITKTNLMDRLGCLALS